MTVVGGGRGRVFVPSRTPTLYSIDFAVIYESLIVVHTPEVYNGSPRLHIACPLHCPPYFSFTIAAITGAFTTELQFCLLIVETVVFDDMWSWLFSR